MQFYASALVKGNALYPNLLGVVTFHQLPDGVLVNAQFSGLPTVTENGSVRFMGFHIHENGDCSQNAEHGFPNTGNHYNPEQQKHPFHRGDMPPLLNCNGFAWQSFLTNAFTIPEIIGRSVIVHALPDDFVTQPSGNSGAKIGCGVIN